MWIRTVQMSSFESELDFIENSRDCCPPAYVNQFGLVLDDQHILRCKGRINNSSVLKEPSFTSFKTSFLRSDNPRCAQENDAFRYSPDTGYSARTILGVLFKSTTFGILSKISCHFKPFYFARFQRCLYICI